MAVGVLLAEGFPAVSAVVPPPKGRKILPAMIAMFLAAVVTVVGG